MKRGQDNDNLYIKKDYVKDPRYFGLSFRNLLEPFLGQIRELSAGQTLEIDLSKKELIILGQADKPQAFVEDRITIFSEDIILPPKSTSSKEIYAFKKLEAGEMCELRAVAIDSDGYLHQGVKIIRWIDTKEITVFLNDYLPQALKLEELKNLLKIMIAVSYKNILSTMM